MYTYCKQSPTFQKAHCFLIFLEMKIEFNRVYSCINIYAFKNKEPLHGGCWLLFYKKKCSVCETLMPP